MGRKVRLTFDIELPEEMLGVTNPEDMINGLRYYIAENYLPECGCKNIGFVAIMDGVTEEPAQEVEERDIKEYHEDDLQQEWRVKLFSSDGTFLDQTSVNANDPAEAIELAATVFQESGDYPKDLEGYELYMEKGNVAGARE
jgi:hypothetical protein